MSASGRAACSLTEGGLYGSDPTQSEAAEQMDRTLITALVDLDGTVDLADEPVGSKETYGAREDPEGEDDDEGVTKVQQCGHELCDLQLQPTHAHTPHTYTHMHTHTHTHTHT